MTVTYLPGRNTEGEKLSTEQVQEMIAWALMAILEKMPQPNVQDQLPVVFPAAQNVSVSGTATVGVANYNGQPSALVPYNLSAGAYHLYQGIQVS